jgi:hypothetical protein
MNDKKEINNLVVGILEKQSPLTARQLFEGVKAEDPVVTKKGFKSFVQTLRINKAINVQPDLPFKYNLLK